MLLKINTKLVNKHSYVCSNEISIRGSYSRFQQLSPGKDNKKPDNANNLADNVVKDWHAEGSGRKLLDHTMPDCLVGIDKQIVRE